MKSPIETLLDQVEWKETPETESVGTWFEASGVNFVNDEGLPYATHEGVMRVGDFEFKCYQLSNGTRVISKESMEAFFGCSMEEVIDVLKKLGS